MRSRAGLVIALLLWAPLSTDATALAIQLDYRFDTRGFFDASHPQGAAARGALERAAAAFASISDALAPIAPASGNTWTTGTFLHPGAGGFVSVADLAVPADAIVVFVGGRPLGGALGFASGSTIGSASGDPAFLETLAARGQLGALDPIPTDFGPWGGSITFNAAAPWHFGVSAGPAVTEQDFLTTATHEIAHILGIGIAASWDARVFDGHFEGAASIASFGEPVRVDATGGHWAEGVASLARGVAQETLMDPTTSRGVREWMTDLDWAGLRDVGWQVVPEPRSAVLFLLGVTQLAFFHRNADRPQRAAACVEESS
jgi:hypothetical protein